MHRPVLGLAPAVAAAALLSATVEASAPPEEVRLRGRAVCLDDAGAAMGAGGDCPDHPAGGWALEATDGTRHPLSPEDQRVAMLGDPRVRSRPLELVVWRYDDGHLAIVHLHTIVDGRRHDPHYYCPVCAIRSNTPGLCWCCQAPFEFREPPVEGGPPLQ